MIGAVPDTATMALQRPDKVVAPGYMQMSGTSFAAPVVSGAAAVVLAKHPDWTPDQVKGALMVSASYLPRAADFSAGVGEVNVDKGLDVVSPPNPNLALNRFVTADPKGGPTPVFDAASWANVAKTDASWANASWANASWANASWANASWANASWANASWANASWANLGADASWANSAQVELNPDTGLLDWTQLYLDEVAGGVDIDGDGVIGDPAAPPGAPIPADAPPVTADPGSLLP